MIPAALKEEAQTDIPQPFGNTIQKDIISLIIDYPHKCISKLKHLERDLFTDPPCKFVASYIFDIYAECGQIPTRDILEDTISRIMTTDDLEESDTIMDVIRHKIEPRKIDYVNKQITEFAKWQTIVKLWDPTFSTALKQKRSSDDVIKICEEAAKIQLEGAKDLDFLEDMPSLFDVEHKEKFTTGIQELDVYLDDGGPNRGEVLVWMAPTGIGKSLTLVNNAAANLKRGKHILYITLELSAKKTAIRLMGAASGLKIVTQECRMANKNAILHVRDALRESGGNVIIVQYPPDEINVDTIYSKIDELHRHHKGFTPDIIIIDYLELLIGRHKADNVDNYLKQKAVATQTRGLAHNTNTCIFTATQTNRAGNEKMLKGESIDQSQIAESFGKAMPIDYLISINPIGDSKSGDEIKDVQLYIAKNRNGPTYKDVQATMNMASMTMKSKM